MVWSSLGNKNQEQLHCEVDDKFCFGEVARTIRDLYVCEVHSGKQNLMESMAMIDTLGIDLKIEKAEYWHGFYDRKVVFTLTNLAECYGTGRDREYQNLLDWLPTWRSCRDRWWTKLRNLHTKREAIINAS